MQNIPRDAACILMNPVSAKYLDKKSNFLSVHERQVPTQRTPLCYASDPASSSSGRDELVEMIGRGLPAEGFADPGVEEVCDVVKVGLAVY